MKTAVAFFSLTGNTKAVAEQIASERGASLLEIKERKKRGFLSAFFNGCLCAMRQQPSKLVEQLPPLQGYDCIILAAPIWAGFPAPAFNNAILALSPGQAVELVFVSSGGDSTKSWELVRNFVERHGAQILSIRDVKAEG